MESLIDQIPFLAKWKLLILDKGVSLNPKYSFNKYPEINSFKTKFAIKQPTIQNLKVFDSSINDIIIPSEIILSKGGERSLVKVGFSKSSPLHFQYDASGNIYLFDNQSRERVDIGIELVKKSNYEKIKVPKEVDSREPFLRDFVQIVGQDRIGILGFEGCWHWNTNRACKFCDSNPKRGDAYSAMPSLNSLADNKCDVQEWWNRVSADYINGIKYTLKYIEENISISPHKHLQYMSGNMPNNKQVWDITLQISEEINKVIDINSYDSYVNIALPITQEKENFRKLKSLGYHYFQFNFEVIGEKYFKEICPGKSSMVAYDNAMKTLQTAVSIFGAGKVRSNFVFGIQPTDILLEGIRNLAEMGIVADYSIFVPKKGTPLENYKSPELHEVIEFTKELADIYRKYNFKPIYCSMSSRSNILHEMLENND